jgi:hypothetical protein
LGREALAWRVGEWSCSSRALDGLCLQGFLIACAHARVMFAPDAPGLERPGHPQTPCVSAQPPNRPPPSYGPAGGGLLRLHSTYRHDLKIYSSDEGRVQMSAAAFAKVGRGGVGARADRPRRVSAQVVQRGPRSPSHPKRNPPHPNPTQPTPTQPNPTRTNPTRTHPRACWTWRAQASHPSWCPSSRRTHPCWTPLARRARPALGLGDGPFGGLEV